ncbi:MAG: trypsin-like peptidase domain-containing protein [Bacteriovoracaceae bacterium]|nr:trypsin-like peptidase domain-containing protein [Bacteriovoracaceae bacterium]
MRILFIALLFVVNSQASINPENQLQPLFKVFGKSAQVDDLNISVEAPYYSQRTRLRKNGDWLTISKSFYAQIKDLAQGVFIARPNKDRRVYSEAHGSAFHVGENLILTAHHVIDINKEKKQCKRFSIRLNPSQNGASLGCEKVIHCNPELDYCLVEMEKSWRGYALEKQAPLVLNAQKITSSSSSIITAIGNTQGFGIHASTGKGAHYIDNEIYFYATVFGGNSGGPIFNDNNEVIGVVTKQTAIQYSPDAINFAAPMNLIREDLIKALGEDSETFKKINFK